jgi:hypothetical protein
MAAHYDIFVEQYATWTLPVLWTDAAETPIDLSGGSALMQVRDRLGTVLIELSSTNGRITLGGAAGTLLLTISDDDTSLLPTGLAAYDLIFETGDGVTTRLLEGSFYVEPGVSHEP